MTDEREIDFQAQVKGLFYRPDSAKQAVEGAMELADECHLVREASNIHDSNAIQVWFIVEDGDHRGDHHIGYIAKEHAVDIAPVMDAGTELYAEVYYFLNPTTPVLQITERIEEEPEPQVETTVTPPDPRPWTYPSDETTA